MSCKLCEADIYVAHDLTPECPRGRTMDIEWILLESIRARRDPSAEAGFMVTNITSTKHCYLSWKVPDGAWQCPKGHMFSYEPPPAWPPWCGKCNETTGFRWIIRDEVTSHDYQFPARLHFNGVDIETEQYMGYVGLADEVDDSPNKDILATEDFELIEL